MIISTGLEVARKELVDVETEHGEYYFSSSLHQLIPYFCIINEKISYSSFIVHDHYLQVKKFTDHLLRFNDSVYPASRISFVMALCTITPVFAQQIQSNFNLKGRLLPSLGCRPLEIAMPPVSIPYVKHFGSYLSAVFDIPVLSLGYEHIVHILCISFCPFGYEISLGYLFISHTSGYLNLVWDVTAMDNPGLSHVHAPENSA